MLFLYQVDIPEEAIKEIALSLRNNQLIYGAHCKKFEESFSEYLNVSYCHAVSSGTAALHLSMLALDINEGDLVFIPDFTWPSTVNVVEMVGATPIFIDVDKLNHCLDLEALERQINNYNSFTGKKVILPVHQHGYPMDMEKLTKIAKKYDALVVEDAACAIGSEFNGIKVGNFSDIACFSFHPRKVMTTAEGGMVVTNNPNLAERLRRLLNHGFLSEMQDFKYPGLNYRMTEMQAILGSFGLKELDLRINKRRKVKDYYFKFLKDIEGITLPQDHASHNWQTFLITLDKDINRELFLKKLNNEGINAVNATYSLISLEYFVMKYGDSFKVPNSKLLASQGVALPFSEKYGKEEAQKIASHIENTIKELNLN